MLPRVLFHAGAPVEPGQSVELDARRSHHLVRVLRLAAGARLEAFDGQGRSFAAALEVADPQRCLLRLGEPQHRDLESALHVTLAQCLSSAERMDWTIEKAVELGVRAIVPLGCARSQVRLDAARAARKHEHWRHIVESACSQSGRSSLPELRPLEALGTFLASLGPAGPGERRLALDPGAARRLSTIGVAPGTRLVLLVGPESGLAERELEAAHAAGFEGVTLGPRILRTETAGLAAIAALQALAGDF